MANYFFRVLLLVTYLAVHVPAQKTQELIIDGYEDDIPRDGEVTFPDGETKDREYFASLEFTKDEIPKELPDERQVLKEYSVQSQRGAIEQSRSGAIEQSRSGAIELEAEKQLEGDKTVLPAVEESAKTAVSAGNLYVSYLQQSLTKFRKCCPRSQSYRCSSDTLKLSCFKVYRNGRKGVCCPLWPQVTYVRCNCGQCTRLCANCVQTGTCVHNYTYKWFIAVCYNLGFWNKFLVFNKYLPTSCTCNAPNCI